MLLKKVQKQIQKWNMIEPGDRIIVGVSGGADSVALLLLLQDLREELEFSLEVIHVEHGIRGDESKEDEIFVEKMCGYLHVYCYTYSVDVPSYATENGLGIEEAARKMRYDIFESLAKERHAKIALAHHMEDNAETILFQMARGSSLAGLCGIQPVREDASGTIYIRPLLSVHREELEKYLAEIGQEFCVDSTNSDVEYSRNYIRNLILPNLVNVNAQAVAHINEAASYLSEVHDFLEKEVESAWEQIASVNVDIVLDIEKLKALHVVLQKELIYKAISIMEGGKKDISSTHVERLLLLLDNQSGKEVSLPNHVVAIKENETIRLFSSVKNKDKIDGEYRIDIKEETLRNLLNTKKFLSKSQSGCFEFSVFEKTVSEGEIPRKPYTKWLDYDKISKGFCIRTRRSGDYFICDEFGHRKKLKQYFVDEKIPVTKRDEVLLLAQDDMVLWIVGGRISEHVKVTDETKRILEITYKEEA
ncbi:MAG: tRNA lysidine(34) synthetase TilS [Agathobacter sp.]|nr:tRNA lysidine(34) synthetase TilS [Agathobacter sp.]